MSAGGGVSPNSIASQLGSNFGDASGGTFGGQLASTFGLPGSANIGSVLGAGPSAINSMPFNKLDSAMSGQTQAPLISPQSYNLGSFGQQYGLGKSTTVNWPAPPGVATGGK